MLNKLQQDSIQSLLNRSDMDWSKETLMSSIAKIQEETSEVMDAYEKYMSARGSSNVDSFFNYRDHLASELIDVIRASLSCLYHLGVNANAAWNKNINQRR